MMNKYLQFIIFDFRVVIKVLILLALAALTLIGVKYQKYQENQIKEISMQKDLVAMIPQMEKAIELKIALKVEPKKKEIVYNLEGISRYQDSYNAIINGKIYAVGDTIDEYKVTTIEMNHVILTNMLTNGLKEFHLAVPEVKGTFTINKNPSSP